MNLNSIKKIFIALVLILPASVYGEPSKKDTTQYILDKLKEDSDVFRNKYEFKEEGCVFNTMYPPKGSGEVHHGGKIFDLNDVQIYSRYFGEGYGKPQDWGHGIMAKCKSKKCVKHYYSNGKVWYQSGDSQLFSKYSDNQVLLNRIVKAFNHLIMLCDNNKELF